MEDINLLNEKTKSSYFPASTIFLVVVLVATILLYLYNNYIENSIKDIQNDTTTIEASIKEVENDKNIQIYRLIELNKEVIASYESMNKITKYINHLNELKSKYNLEFNWFDLSKWEIVTNIKTTSDDGWLAYQKTRDFINKYRLDPKWLFDLWFVSSVEWMDEIKFKVNFKIKNNLNK